VAGRITARPDTGAAVAALGATVSVVGSPFGTITAADGRYVLPSLPAGPVTVRVHLLGFRAVQRAVRVRILDGKPMSYLVTYVPSDIGRQYDRDELNRRPLLHLLERAGVDVASARQTISATVADAQVASALSVHAGAPLIEVRRVVRDAADRPVEYIRVLYRPDLYRFEMSMRRVREKEGMRWAATSSSPIPAGEEEMATKPGNRMDQAAAANRPDENRRSR